MKPGLVYGGQSELSWGRLLHHKVLYIRLTALRVLSGLGEAGARALLLGPDFRRKGESYPFVWALSRCISPGLLGALRVSASPGHDLLARVRFLVRRALRPHHWRCHLSRAACAEAIVASDHPLQTLACTVRMLELYREDSVPALLEIVRLPAPQLLWDEKAECAAWALGQIGSTAVPEILQEYRNASKRVAAHLATALYYLGAAGFRALPLLLKDDSEFATAALLAMEDKASRELVAAGRGPVWLDEEAVQALAEIAFSDGDRAYAAAALSCFGPASLSALPILKHLARDPAKEVRLNVARGLGWGGRPEGMNLLAELAEDGDPDVAHRARKSMESYYADPSEMRASLMISLRSEHESERRRAAEQLAHIGIEEEEDIRDLLVAGPLLLPLLRALAKARSISLCYRPQILEFSQVRGPVCQAAAELLARWPDDADSRACWRNLLWEDSHATQDLAVSAVQRSGQSLREWNLDAQDILSLPSRVLANLLASLSPHLLQPGELLLLLKRGDPESRLAGATALRYLAPPLHQVEHELEQGLRDPNLRVGIECARTLVALGGFHHRWGLLRSSLPQDRELALAEGELPKRVCQEYVGGLLYSEENSKLLQAFLGPERACELEVKAICKLRSQAGSGRLARLGRLALDKMPELLGHFSPTVRLIALDTVKQLLAGTIEEYSEWLAYHGLVLPIERGVSQAELEQLQRLVCDYLMRAQLWSDLRIRPLWLVLSRSLDANVAARALDSMARAYLRSPDPGLLEGMLLALNHPEDQVRRAALRRLGSHVNYRGWTAPFGGPSSPEACFLKLARRFAEGDLEMEASGLQEALERMRDWPLADSHFFNPGRPAQLLALLELVGRSAACDDSIQRLLWGYREQTGPEVWQRIEALALDPGRANFHPALAERWPSLVLSALETRPDGHEWVLSLGSSAKVGLRLALQHQEAALRLAGLAVIAEMRQGFGEFYRSVKSLAQSDPEPKVQAAARKLLD